MYNNNLLGSNNGIIKANGGNGGIFKEEDKELKSKELYLGEIIDNDGIEFGSNNLIIAPVGSGKTHLIFNKLSNKDNKELMLVSTSSLKESLESEDETFTTRTMRKLRDGSGANVHLMTYAEFGNKVAFDGEFAKDYSNIYCDEIHSLFEFFSYNKDYRLSAAIRYLFLKHDDKDIYYFTATTQRIKQFMDNFYEGVLNNVNVYNFYSNKDIIGHKNMIKFEFTDNEGIMDAIDHLHDFGSGGEKGFIYNERISGMKKIEKLIKSKGYNVISIWSINNKDHEMTDEQLRVRRELLETGIIPEGYDFIIVNGSMREGWNLLDPNVELAILNTRDDTDLIQARGRIRKDITMVAYRVKGEKTPIELKLLRREQSLGVIEKNLGKNLTATDKKDIYEALSIKRDNGRLIKWTAIKDILLNNGYSVKDKSARVDGKVAWVSVITKK